MRGLKGNNMKINDRASWIETYRTVSNVVSQRVAWGTVIGFRTEPGDRDGFSIAGTYVNAMPVEGGGSVFVLDNQITSFVKA